MNLIQMPAKPPTHKSSVTKKIMIYQQKLIYFFQIFILLLCSLFTTMALASDKQHILVLNSYHQSMSWEEDIYRALKDVFSAQSGEFDLHVDYMDTKRVPYTPAYERLLFELYHFLYVENKVKHAFDVIIATDNNAYDFMRKYREQLFPGVPVVFCGVNDFHPRQLQGLHNFTGVSEVFDVVKTLEAALRLHPNTRHLFIINDYLPTGKASTAVMQRDLTRFENSLEIEYAQNWPMQKLLQHLEKLPADTLVLLGVYFRDADDRFFKGDKTTQLLSNASTAPIYGLFDLHLGHGLVGGNLISGYYQGQSAAAIVARILKGEAAETIAVQTTESNRYLFDYKQLQRWQIEESSLPRLSIVINQPYSFYQEYKQWVWLIIFFILLLALIIFSQSQHIFARKRAEAALSRAYDSLEATVRQRTVQLHDSEQNLRILLQNIPMRIYYKSQALIYLAVNPAFAQHLNKTPQVFEGQSDTDFYDATSATRYQAEDQQAMQQENTIEYERENSEARTTHVIKTPVRNEQGQVKGILGILFDVTEHKKAERATKESAARYHYLFVENKAIHLLIDPQTGEIVDVSAGASHFYGYSRSQLKSMKITQLNMLSPEEIKQEMQQAETEQRNYFYFTHRLASGEKRHIELYSSPVDLDNRHLLHTIVHDVTERHMTEQRLRISEENYHSLVESVTSEYMLYRHDTQGIFTYVSPAVKAIIGFSQEEYLQNYQNTLTDNPINQKTIQYTQQAIKGHKQPPYEIEIKTKKGERRRLRVSEAPVFNEHEQVVEVQGIAEDITKAWVATTALKGRNHVLELLAKERDEQDILAAIVAYVETIDPDALCSILRLDRRHNTLHIVAAPRLPAFYSQQIEGIKTGEGVGSCGTAIARKELVISEDMLSDPCWSDFRELMQQTELRSCCSQAIISHHDYALGTFAMYYTKPHVPSNDEIDLIRSAAELTAIVLDTLQAQKSLRELEERERLLLESGTEGIIGLDVKGNTTFINPAAATMLGYKVEELSHCNSHDLIHLAREDDTPIPISECRMQAAALQERDYHVTDEVLWRKDGSHFPVEYWSTPIRRNDQVVGAVVTFHDISERRKVEQRIAHIAYHDSLTGLPNRALFKDRLKTALAYLQRHHVTFAVFLMDLDHFKDVNDSLGHPAGDVLLEQVTERLSAMVRNEDTLARMGGDEFALIQTHVHDVVEVSLLAERIIQTIRKPFTIHGTEVSIGITMGIQMIPEPAPPPDTMLSNADVALYRAKEAGRGCYMFYEDMMTQQLHFEVELVNRLSHAINAGELYVLYQPQVDMQDIHHIKGVEALVRWNHPQHGNISPDKFIPIAEKRAVIEQIGNFVLEKVCQQAGLWLQQGFDFGRISINISAAQLRTPQAINDIVQVIRYHQIPFARIELELTESVLFQLDDAARELIAQLVQQGLQFSIDDFGTGYSSLAYLRSIQVQRLKIDHKFIRDMLTDNHDLQIIKAIISLGHALNIKVIAEGVEQREQVDLLRSYGCHFAQGYYFSKPVTGDAISKQFMLEPCICIKN